MKRFLVGALVVALGVGWFVTRADGASARYRVATATTQSVTETLDEVGTVEPVSAASVGFSVAGTVARVVVAPGTSVTRGQPLATLDTSDLDSAVDAAQAALDQAKLTLANALAAESGGDAQPQPQPQGLTAAQQAVVDGQRLVTEALSAAHAALESATAVCAAVSESSVAACQDALNDVLRAQRETSDAQSALSAASSALETLRNESSRPSAPGSSASAEQLRQFQKDVDAANAALAVAKQAVAAATIVSPFDGTVEAVGFGAGDAVAVGVATDSIRVVGPSGFEVTAIVSVDDLADLAIGQRAVVTPDGSDRQLDGEIVSVGAPRSSNGSTTYPVTIGVDDDSALRNGTVARVAIVVEESRESTVVPTSAVHSDGARKSVTVLRDGRPDEVTVRLGAIGRRWTAIDQGVKAGDQVVLAELDTPLPSDATRTRNEGRGGGPVVIERGGPMPGGGPVGIRLGQ